MLLLKGSIKYVCIVPNVAVKMYYHISSRLLLSKMLKLFLHLTCIYVCMHVYIYVIADTYIYFTDTCIVSQLYFIKIYIYIFYSPKYLHFQSSAYFYVDQDCYLISLSVFLKKHFLISGYMFAGMINSLNSRLSETKSFFQHMKGFVLLIPDWIVSDEKWASSIHTFIPLYIMCLLLVCILDFLLLIGLLAIGLQCTWIFKGSFWL